MKVLIDLGHLFWRNWHATSSDIHAYELTLETCDWWHKEHADVAICCDSPRSFRREMLDTYKANREAKPRQAIDALRSVQDRIEDWGVPVLTVDGYEADDVIADIAREAEANFEEVTIVSNDKDLYQLLSPLVTMIARGQRIGPDECVAKFGVPPSQMRDWLAIVGDASDNVVGCEHTGPGRATTLLRAFGSIDGIKSASDDDILALRGIGQKTLAALREWDPSTAIEMVTIGARQPKRQE